jgi:hypothetical protein
MKQDIEGLLEKFRNELGLALGSNLEQVVLYGSRARGDSRGPFAPAVSQSRGLDRNRPPQRRPQALITA